MHKSSNLNNLKTGRYVSSSLSSSLKLQDLRCHGNNSKQTNEVVEHSIIKETTMSIGLKQEKTAASCVEVLCLLTDPSTSKQTYVALFTVPQDFFLHFHHNNYGH